MNTWSELSTCGGQLLEMRATLTRAKQLAMGVLEDFPEEAYGSAWLEQAIGLLGRVETELDSAHDEAS